MLDIRAWLGHNNLHGRMTGQEIEPTEPKIICKGLDRRERASMRPFNYYIKEKENE